LNTARYSELFQKKTFRTQKQQRIEMNAGTQHVWVARVASIDGQRFSFDKNVKTARCFGRLGCQTARYHASHYGHEQSSAKKIRNNVGFVCEKTSTQAVKYMDRSHATRLRCGARLAIQTVTSAAAEQYVD
jgi:predicted transcriptional regulator